MVQVEFLPSAPMANESSRIELTKARTLQLGPAHGHQIAMRSERDRVQHVARRGGLI
jgi:hypothetical protein